MNKMTEMAVSQEEINLRTNGLYIFIMSVIFWNYPDMILPYWLLFLLVGKLTPQTERNRVSGIAVTKAILLTSAYDPA